jgi:hypothetical protein
MYLTELRAKQVSSPSYDVLCRVELRWNYGNQDTEVMEFWWKGGSDDHWTWIAELGVNNGSPESTEIWIPAGVPGLIIACPRLLDDVGAKKNRQPDDDGEELIWNGFCLFKQFVGERLEGPPPQRCHTAPQITALDVGHGSVTVRWTNPEGYDRFRIEFAGSTGGPAVFWTENHEYRFEKLPTGGYWARVAGIHEGNDWTGTSDCTSPWSDTRETSIPFELGYIEAKFTPGAPIGVLKQNADHTELFGCLPDGRPVAIWSDDLPVWHPWYGHGSGPGFPGGAPLTALSRDDGHMDVFGVASDGRVHLAWWHGNPWQEWFALSDPEFPPGAFIAAVSRNSDQMDIFVVGSDAVVRSNWWNGDPWREWFPLEGLSFPPGAPIAAISRNPNQMDIFVVGFDGIVRSNWWNGDPWRGWFELSGASFPPGAHVAATTRNDDQMDIFVVGYDGIVRSNWWNGNPWRGWFELGGATFPPGASISALSPSPNLMEITAVATDGQARWNRWNGNWSGWNVLPGATFPAGAILSGADSIYGVASDGYMRGTHYSGWYPVK